MIRIIIYGLLKKKFFSKAKLTDDTIIKLENIEGEDFYHLLTRLQLEKEDIGECFLNHKVVEDFSKKIPENSRVAIFSVGMHLIDGGSYITMYPQTDW